MVAVTARMQKVRAGRGRRALPQLVCTSELDRRTNAARPYDALVEAVVLDLGGRENLSTIEMALVSNFASHQVIADALSAKMLLGEQINLERLSNVCGTLIRLASRLGLQRRPRDVSTPSVSRYLSEANEAAE